jgi:hypothetical protein
MRRTLGGVHQAERARFVRYPTDVGYGIDGAQHIGDMRDGDHAGALGYEAAQLVQVEPSLVGDAPDHDSRPLRARNLHPGQDVGVVFHFRDDNLVAFAQLAATPTRRHQVDTLRGASCEDDFGRLTRVQEAGDLFACRLEQLRRFGTDAIRAPMDIRIMVRIEVHQGVQHGIRLLCGRRVIQINQAAHFGMRLEEGELPPYLMRIQLQLYGCHGCSPSIEQSDMPDGPDRSDGMLYSNSTQT